MRRLFDLLQTWPEGHRLPDLWLSAECDCGDVVANWLEHLVIPRSGKFAFEALLRRGAFSAAELLLMAPSFQTEVGAAELQDLEWDLEARRNAARTRMEDELERVLERSRRAICTIADLDQRLQTIALLSSEDWDAAERHLREVVNELEACEAQRRSQLLSVLGARRDDLGATSRIGSWADLVERSLAAGHFDLAEAAIEAGPQEDLPEGLAPLPPLPPLWPFREPARVVCSWVRPGAEARRDFFGSWAPAEEDTAARELLERLEPVLSMVPTEEEVGQFVLSLEAYAGTPMKPNPRVERLGKGFLSWVRGLHHPAIPFIHPLSFPDGLPIYVAGGQEEDDLTEINASIKVVFTTASTADDDDAIVRLRPEDLFKLLPDRVSRKRQILRVIGRQLRLTDALGLESMRSHGALVFGRDAESAGIRGSDHCIFGAPGVGKTALLKKILADLEEEGWLQCYLDVSGPDLVMLEQLSQPSGRQQMLLEKLTPAGAWAIGKQTLNLTVGLDHANELPASVLSSFLESLEKACLNVRLFLVGDFELRDRMASVTSRPLQHHQVGPLHFHMVRRFAEEIIDVHGLRVRSEDVLDRLADASLGRPVLLLLLLRELFLQHDIASWTRRAAITNRHLDLALAASAFRESASSMILKPLERDPNLKRVLAAVVLELSERRESEGGATEDDVRLWLTICGFDFDKGEIQHYLEKALALGYIESRTVRGDLFLARGTIGSLLSAQLERPLAILDRE